MYKPITLTLMEAAQLSDVLEAFASRIDSQMLPGYKREAENIRAMAAELTERRQIAQKEVTK